MQRFRLATMALTLLLTTILGTVAARADATDDLTTASVKAAFIYNFAKFAIWPTDRLEASAGAIGLCVQGGDLDRRALSPLEEKRIDDRPVRVEILAPGAPIDGCHVFFASRFQSETDLRRILVVARSRAVLMVSDSPGFAAQGGHIGLVEDRSRLRFQVNLPAVSEAGVKLSSKLLQLAEIVGPVRE